MEWARKAKRGRLEGGSEVEGRESSQDRKKRLWGRIGLYMARRDEAREGDGCFEWLRVSKGRWQYKERKEKQQRRVCLAEPAGRDARKKESSPDGPSRSHIEASMAVAVAEPSAAPFNSLIRDTTWI